MIVTINSVTKRFGTLKVLNNLSLKLFSGQVYCLLGRNGAGKSTLINIIANLIEVYEGSLTIGNKSFREGGLELKKKIGLQSQYDQLIEELNAGEYLEMVGLIYKLKKQDIKTQIENLLSFFFDEGEDLSKKIKGYSTGMKKKLAICASIIHKPNLLLLDEPFANLDAIATDKVCQLISAYVNSERTIFISSHDLLYVDKVATHIGILDNGELVYNDSIDRFKNQGKMSLFDNLLQYLKPSTINNELLINIV
jgi:ABC-2 type transport system ATP-binding protein